MGFVNLLSFFNHGNNFFETFTDGIKETVANFIKHISESEINFEIRLFADVHKLIDIYEDFKFLKSFFVVFNNKEKLAQLFIVLSFNESEKLLEFLFIGVIFEVLMLEKVFETIEISAILDLFVSWSQDLNLAFKVSHIFEQVLLDDYLDISVDLVLLKFDFFVDSIEELELLVVIYKFLSIYILHRMLVFEFASDLFQSLYDGMEVIKILIFLFKLFYNADFIEVWKDCCDLVIRLNIFYWLIQKGITQTIQVLLFYLKFFFFQLSRRGDMNLKMIWQ